MNPSIGRILLIVGIVVFVLALIAHFALKVSILPHFSIILGAIAVILAAIGAFGMMYKSRGA